MKRKVIILLISATVISLCSLSLPKIYTYCMEQNAMLKIEDNKVYSSELPDDSFKSNYTAKLSFADMPITEVNNVKINFLSHKNLVNMPILLKAQRYYFPLDYVCNFLNYNLSTDNNTATLTNSENTINLTSSTYTSNSKSGNLRGGLLKKDNKNYIAVSDIEQIFNIFAIFDFKNNTINFYPNSKTENTTINNDISYTENIAFFRFEDVTAGDSYLSDKNQTKVKLMANYLNSNNIKYHVAWIPHFKAPSSNIDNDLLTETSIENVGFINMLDYMINNGGEVGLHGYTHQYGDSRSAVGTELSKDYNTDETSVRNVIESSIDTASALNIPVTFFESPHYTDISSQQDIIKEYFQVLYEPLDYTNKNILKTDTNNIFVPTPVGFVENNDPSNIIDALNDKDSTDLKSFFYHPSIETDYFDYNTDNDKVNVTISDDSILKKIVTTLKDDDYTTLHVSELKK